MKGSASPKCFEAMKGEVNVRVHSPSQYLSETMEALRMCSHPQPSIGEIK